MARFNFLCCLGNAILVVTTATTLAQRETPAPTNVVPPCPRDFIGHSDSCYHSAHIKATWPEAIAYCESFGAELARIEDEQEQIYLANMLNNLPNGAGNESHWLGATDILVEGEWQWAITLQKLTYTNWDAGQPNNHDTNEHCLEISGDRGYKWNDNGCEEHKFFICETPSE